MNRLRILVLGPECNPETVSIAYVTYKHVAALAEIHDVTLVARDLVEDRLLRAKAPFRAIEIVRTPVLNRIFNWGFRTIFRSNPDGQLLTAFKFPFYLAFECLAWLQLRNRIRAGEFDVVLRVMPMAAVLPSPFAYFLRKGPIPFVIGPLQGGLRSAPGFSQSDTQNFTLRKLYRFMPFFRSTYKYSAAIIAAVSHLRHEFAVYSDKMFFIPENGIARSLCLPDNRNSVPGAKLQLIFVGGFVRRKAVYVGLRAAAPLLRKGLAHFTLIGNGPEEANLHQLVQSLEIEKAVTFCGWLSNPEVLERLRNADVVLLPAIREGGGGVVFEGLACGSVPVILDWGGPGDICHPEVGYKVPPSTEEQVIAEFQDILATLEADRELLCRLRERGMKHARECLTWEAKARATTLVLNWVLGRGPKPDLPWSRMARVKWVGDIENDSRNRPGAGSYTAVGLS
jgi:glycosyltransferase involved in cell wall biosynthesis